MSIDIDAVKNFLSREAAVDEIAFLGSGEWSTAYLFAREGRRLVARFGAHPEDFRKDRRAFGLYGSIMPIPRILEIGEAFDGLSYAVSEWFAGERIDRIPEHQLRAAQPSLLEMLGVLSTAPLPISQDSSYGFGWWTPEGNASHESWREVLLSIIHAEEHPRVAGWRAFLETNAEWSRAFEAAASRLEDLAGACPPNVSCVLHGDLTAGNVLIEGTRVSAVIDWGNSLVGDPLYDVAWLVFWSPWHPGLDADFILSETRKIAFEGSAVEVDHFEERLLACYLYIGLDSMAYNAFRKTEVHLNGTIERLAALVAGFGTAA